MSLARCDAGPPRRHPIVAPRLLQQYRHEPDQPGRPTDVRCSGAGSGVLGLSGPFLTQLGHRAVAVSVGSPALAVDPRDWAKAFDPRSLVAAKSP
jgi:hypothetical protein